MASRRSPAPTYVRFIDKMPCIFDKKLCFIFFLITDLADLSEAPPLREQFFRKSAKSVIISDFVNMHKIEI